MLDLLASGAGGNPICRILTDRRLEDADLARDLTQARRDIGGVLALVILVRDDRDATTAERDLRALADG